MKNIKKIVSLSIVISSLIIMMFLSIFARNSIQERSTVSALKKRENIVLYTLNQNVNGKCRKEMSGKIRQLTRELEGKWEVIEWSILHGQYSKENYDAAYDNMIGMSISINEDGKVFWENDEYRLVNICVRDYRWLMEVGIVLNDAQIVGKHVEFQFEALNEEDWLGNKFVFSIIAGENGQWYITPCYSMNGGYYSIQKVY